jgi:DNA-binding MarR family transcriptional regulator
MPSPNSLRDAQSASFGHVLFDCARRLDEIAQARLNAEAGTRLARPSVMRLVPFITREGVRPIELARRLDVSKQAVAQALALLEEQGFITNKPDPSDGRGRLVCLTDAGEAAHHRGLKVLADLEGEVRDRVGSTSIATTFRGLKAIQEILSEWESSPPKER